MTKPTIDDDLTLAFILGRDGGGLSFSGAVALTFVASLGVAAAVASGVTSGDAAYACFLLVAVVLAWWSSPAAATVIAAIAFLFADGFAVDTGGVLAWHGEADLLRLVALVALSVTVSFLGSGRRARLREKAEHDSVGVGMAS